MGKVTTMKDIANAAGVSLTTVSYVLNQSSTQKISHEMRLKIISLAKEMDYVPNYTAKALANKRSNMLGVLVIVDRECSKSRLYGYYDLFHEIQKQAAAAGYDTILISIEDMENDIKTITRRALDGMIIIDVCSDYIYNITNKYYVPILFVDCIVEDKIFLSIISDYVTPVNEMKKAFGTEDVFLVMENYNNEAIKQEISKYFDTDHIYLNTGSSDLEAFMARHRNWKGIVIGEILGIKVERLTDPQNIAVFVPSSRQTLLLPATKKVVISNKNKAKHAISTMMDLIHLKAKSSASNIVRTSGEEGEGE